MQRRTLLVGLLISLVVGLPTQAQSPVRPYLERVAWTPQERGPLLVVAPDIRVPRMDGDHVPNYALIPPEGELNVLDIAEVLERKQVHSGNLSALVPENIRALSSNLGKPDLNQLHSHDALIALTASLDERQWKLLSGPDGIRESDLSAQQQRFFARLRPQSLESHGSPIPADALAQARVRLNRSLSLSFAFQDKALNMGTNIIGEALNFSPEQSRPSLTPNNRTHALDTYGVVLRNIIPNRLRPSQLDTRAFLDRRMTLEGATTVAELLERASQATGLTLVADRRMAQLPIWQRSAPGQTVRVGDLLELLVWSVAGAFRQLPLPNKSRLWLLTDDIEGLTVRLERQRLWLAQADAAVEKQRRKWNERIKMIAKEQLIPLDTSLGLSEDSLQPLRSARQNSAQRVPLSALAPPTAAKVQSVTERYKAGKVNLSVNGVRNPALDTENILVQVGQSQLQWEVPGYGRYSDSGAVFALDSEIYRASATSTPPPPIPVPTRPDIRQRIVIFAPQSVEEARQAVNETAKAKLSAVWIATDGSSLDVLKAALIEGTKVGVAVGAQVPLACLPKAARADVTVLGEPGPYRIPDAPETLQALLPLLQAIATLPDLAGLAFSESGAPGYLSKTQVPSWPDKVPYGYGYTLARRLSFLHTDGYDPIDLANDSIGFLTLENSFDSDGQPASPDPMQRWHEARYEANKALLVQVYTALKAAAPTLPLWLKARSGVPAPTWFGSWDKPDALPSFALNDIFSSEGELYPFNALPQARHSSREVLLTWLPERYSKEDTTPFTDILSFVLAFGARNTKTFLWNGAILDLSTLPLTKAIVTLQEVKL